MGRERGIDIRERERFVGIEYDGILDMIAKLVIVFCG